MLLSYQKICECGITWNVDNIWTSGKKGMGLPLPGKVKFLCRAFNICFLNLDNIPKCTLRSIANPGIYYKEERLHFRFYACAVPG